MSDSALAECVAVPAATLPLPIGHWLALTIAEESRFGGMLRPCVTPTPFMPYEALTLSKFLL
ncbi:hypothetical protein [Hymenobacter baengnokdamensis]|uniref:hypothetical protein n=1 Tax=Hymenobacter baengnokdamensis TaxID=2615203 RepID=UPI001248080B|nr:hypothetical protein [Hymenobacter baengnokdamensis]